MPDSEIWDNFFDPYFVLKNMQIDSSINKYLDIGCGYGTFLFPASESVKKAIGYDIDENMILYCQNLRHKLKKTNIEIIHGDISNQSSDDFLENNKNTFDYVSLFNILHCEDPVSLLTLAKALITENGRIGVIHWQYRDTPRGPAMNIRPRPEQIIMWANSISLDLKISLDLPPYHYGIIFTK